MCSKTVREIVTLGRHFFGFPSLSKDMVDRLMRLAGPAEAQFCRPGVAPIPASSAKLALRICAGFRSEKPVMTRV